MSIYRPAQRKIMPAILGAMDHVHSLTPRPIDFVAIFIHPAALEELVMSVRLTRDQVGANKVFGMTIEESETEPADPGFSLQWYPR
jgi:hypothetical protein